MPHPYTEFPHLPTPQLGLPMLVLIATEATDKENGNLFRKPATGMWQHLQQHLNGGVEIGEISCLRGYVTGLGFGQEFNQAVCPLMFSWARRLPECRSFVRQRQSRKGQQFAAVSQNVAFMAWGLSLCWNCETSGRHVLSHDYRPNKGRTHGYSAIFAVKPDSCKTALAQTGPCCIGRRLASWKPKHVSAWLFTIPARTVGSLKPQGVLV